MKRTKWLSFGAVALMAAGLFLSPSSVQAGTHVSVNLGGFGFFGPGYCRPVAYCPPPCYAQPVVYQQAYYPAPAYYAAPAYYPAPVYRPYPANYGGYYHRANYYGGPAYH